MGWISDVVNPFMPKRHRKNESRRRNRHGVHRSAGLEQLEGRRVLAAVAPSNFPIQLVQSGSELTITYSQPDPATGFVQTSDQHVVIDIDEYFAGIGAPTQRVNVYASTDPNANFGAPVAANKVFLGITAIHVTVPNYDAPGVNNNSLTIKGINGPTDRIIVSGSGRTAAGRWSDEAAPQLQTVFDIAGIDDLTVTAGGTINVSGAFTNDTGDASIHAVGEIVERQSDQMTATVVIGETTPAFGSLPHSRLVSNYIEMIGAELDIYSDIEATGQVILRQATTTPQTGRVNLILPYDITVTDPDGVLELHSTRSIVQLQSATFIANKLVAISNVGDINLVDADNSEGPWLIDLGSVNNDFDTISLGMVSNATDTPSQDQAFDARGRIGVRDIDDLTVADFGILATTGIVTLRSVGPLTIDAAVQAAGLTLQSDTSVASTPRAIMSVNSPTPDTGSSEPVVYTDLGITIDTSTASGDTATGDVTLDGRIVMDLNNVREDETTTNKTSYGGVTIHAAGVTNFNSQVLTLGDIRVHSKLGINVAGQLQAGGTFVSKDGTKTELVASDLSLTTATGGITVASPSANLPLPTTLSATNLLAFDAGGDISIGGSLFAGTIYGSVIALPTDNATLPSITIRTAADIEMAQSAVLRTSAYGTNYDASPNPQIGLITISDANSVTSAAKIDADGALAVSVRGDITMSGPAVARERVSLRTQTGNIDIQGSLTSAGAQYATTAGTGTPPFVVPASWTPDVVLDAPNGAIATSDTGSLTAGTLILGTTTSYGTVRLNAQQDITIAADINTPGAFTATSKLGTFELSALLQTNNDASINIVAADGILESDLDLARIATPLLDVLNTGAAGGASDIDLRAKNNQIGTLIARNLAIGGGILVSGSDAAGPLVVTGLTAQRNDATPSTVSLSSSRGIQQTGPIVANRLEVSNTSAAAITLANSQNNVDQFSARNEFGPVSYTDADDFETGIVRSKIGVEVIASNLALSSVAEGSTIRVVSGMRFRTLSIAAGTLGGASVGTVEFVTTSNSDNPGAGFAGTLRDMIGYVNANRATYVDDGAVKVQPMAMAFDEDGFGFGEIQVKAALPAFSLPVRFDGSRLESTVAADRLGISGTKTAATGLSFTRGSSGSSISETAVYGFTNGAGISLSSGSNVVTNTYLGVRADGTAAANKIGVDIAGNIASGNLIGSAVFDDTTANRFSANSLAAIQVRGGAANTRIFGNIIGDETGLSPTLANGDGIRINAARTTVIGTPNQVHLDLTPSESNRIVGNKGNGINILSTASSSTATATRLRNNFIAGNAKSGVAISGSQFVTLGGVGENSSNVITSQGLHGVSIAGSTDVSLIGNLIGTDASSSTLVGNKGDGVAIAGSQRIAVSTGNRIVANGGNGVSVSAASTKVTISGSTIGGLLDDGVTSAGNVKDGIAITASVGNSVAAGNVIARNGGSGVSISDARAAALAEGNRVFGSEIFGNTFSGVYIAGGSRSTIGGVTRRSANVIHQNLGDGIHVDYSSTTGAATGHAIQANFIGTNPNGDVAPLGNVGSGIAIRAGIGNTVSDGNVVMNNRSNGITISGGSGNVVGGVSTARGNMISENVGSGIVVTTTAGLPVNQASLGASRGHVIQGNTVAYNGSHGVLVTEATGARTTGVAVGQSVNATKVSGAGNAIFGNGGFGVSVAAAAQQVSVQGNSIAENLGGGLSVAPGANTSATTAVLQLNQASIRQASGGGQQLVLAGAITATASNPFRTQFQQYTIDIYANAPDDDLYGGNQMRRLLGRVTVTADRNGNVDFTGLRALVISANVEIGEVITATVTAVRYQPGSTSGQTAGIATEFFGI